MVPVLSIVFIVINMICGCLLPIGLLLLLSIKYKAKVSSFFIGAGTMLLFALILEQLLHMVVLGSPVGETINNNIWLYGIYGGLAAGIFEETGRFLAMKFAMKKCHGQKQNAIMYGAGHGGFEMFALVGIGYINNLLYAVMINAGMIETMMAPLDDATKEILKQAIDTIITTPPAMFSVALIERLAALTAQIGLSIIVWKAVTRKGKVYLYPVAILLHMLMDTVSAIIIKKANVAAAEIFICLFAVVIVLIGIKIYKNLDDTVENAENA